MYLSEIKIRNFRNHRNSKFIIKKGTNSIIGENDSGKSNFIKALRMLLDDRYYFSNKTLENTDFNDSLDNWKGHWIIISSKFEDITVSDAEYEDIASIVNINENRYISKEKISSDVNKGYFSLIIRPNSRMRSLLSNAENDFEFSNIRNSITTLDYEVIFTSKKIGDIEDDQVYQDMIGDLDNFNYKSPEEDDSSLIGVKINPREFQSYISLVTIGALRDVETDLRKKRNPLNVIIDNIQESIDVEVISDIENSISSLNSKITDIQEITEVTSELNTMLKNLIGDIYSPEVKLQSQLNNSIESLSKYISMKTKGSEDISILGLGQLNIIYIALKLAEFKYIQENYILNIMLIEEPEAHIHHHIQRTLFSKINEMKEYTQVIMSTHSVHISEASKISRMNILIPDVDKSITVQPTTNLDEYNDQYKISNSTSLTNSIERYLDIKRSTLLFSKGVILIEGDGEEFVLPSLFKEGLGIDINELGLNIINVGSVSFESIASLFHEDRIMKYCSIITDLDKQAVEKESNKYSERSEKLGKSRKERLEQIFKENEYVEVFTNDHTFEIELLVGNNKRYFHEVIKDVYKCQSTIKNHIENSYKDLSVVAESILTVANYVGKGWFAIKTASKIDNKVIIPDYILKAFAHSTQRIITEREICNMMYFEMLNNNNSNNELAKKLLNGKIDKQILLDFKESYPNSNVQRLIDIIDN